ncbi:MAG: NAD(P)-dependent oxidoreductase [Hyphomicrobiales bacterium]
MSNLKDKTLFITGASRGIGKAIALRAAHDGANVVIAAKTAEAHPKLDGTIFTAAEEIEAAGGNALPLVVDVRVEDNVASALKKAADKFGGIDILINNASAINLANTEKLEMKRYDLMNSINARGTFMTTKLAVPYLKEAANPHVIMLSPPLDMSTHWFAPHVGYSIAKYGMSLCVLGFAGEFKRYGIGVNALWPRTTIATAAVGNLLGGDAMMQASRKPDILADAAHAMLMKNSKEFTGNFIIDDTFLAGEGVTDFDKYRVDGTVSLMPDFFVPADMTPPDCVNLKPINK